MRAMSYVCMYDVMVWSIWDTIAAMSSVIMYVCMNYVMVWSIGIPLEPYLLNVYKYVWCDGEVNMSSHVFFMHACMMW